MKQWMLVGMAVLVLVAMCATVPVPSFAAQESRFKNIQVLKGKSDKEIQDSMQLWAKQLGVKCSGCHVQGDFASDDKKEKVTARKMYQMVQMLNEQEFFKAGERKADCFMCHKGSEHIPAEGN